MKLDGFHLRCLDRSRELLLFHLEFDFPQIQLAIVRKAQVLLERMKIARADHHRSLGNEGIRAGRPNRVVVARTLHVVAPFL